MNAWTWRIDEMILTGENQEPVINLSQCRCAHHKSHVGWPQIEPGSSRWKQATNRLNHGTAFSFLRLIYKEVTFLQNLKTKLHKCSFTYSVI
jgi:hypothetical protein